MFKTNKQIIHMLKMKMKSKKISILIQKLMRRKVNHGLEGSSKKQNSLVHHRLRVSSNYLYLMRLNKRESWVGALFNILFR